MSDAEPLLLARRDRLRRPDHYEELLLEPLVDGDSETNRFGSYKGWEEDHCEHKRFYVAGIKWLFDHTGLNQTTLNAYRDRAPAQVLERTGWAAMPDPKNFWREKLGQPQIRHACRFEPVPFAKAAQILMTCEIALEDLIEKPRDGFTVPEGFGSAEQIYGYMGILPACYNIDDFSTAYLEEVRQVYKDALVDLKKAAGLRSTTPIADLSKGMTVTQVTARQIQIYATKNLRVSNNHIGDVRAKPGRYLGNGHATEKEEVNVR